MVQISRKMKKSKWSIDSCLIRHNTKKVVGEIISDLIIYFFIQSLMKTAFSFTRHACFYNIKKCLLPNGGIKKYRQQPRFEIYPVQPRDKISLILRKPLFCHKFHIKFTFNTRFTKPNFIEKFLRQFAYLCSIGLLTVDITWSREREAFTETIE